MSVLVYSLVNAVAELAALIAAVPFVAPVLKLYENDFTPTADSILADFTEATFGGYADITLAWGAVGLDGTQTPVAPAPVIFTGDGVTPGVAYGAYLLDSTGALVAATRFDGAPLNFASAGSQLAGTLLFGFTKGTFSIAVGP